MPEVVDCGHDATGLRQHFNFHGETPMKRMKMLSVFFFLAILAWAHSVRAAGCDGAGNCYIYASASGSGTGANWTNAYTGLGSGAGKINPASMARGVVYWIAAGSYGQQAFTTAASGSSIITVESATTANHGPAGDWSNAFAGQALFSGDTTVTTAYWTFTGQSRGSDARSGYNLKFWNSSDNGGTALDVSGANVVVDHAEIEGTNGNYGGSGSDDGFQWDSSANTFYMGYSWVHDAGVDLVVGYNVSGSVFEFNVFERNHVGLDSNHAQAFRVCGPSNMTVRYNAFRDITNTAVIDTAGNGCSISNWYIYGNTNYWTSSVHLTGTSGQADGFVAFFGEVSSGVIQVYNNTFAGINGAACVASVVCNTSAIFVCGNSCSYGGCPGGNCGSPTVTAYNNLWWNPQSGEDFAIDSSGSSWTPTGGYGQNYCASTGCTNGGGFSLNSGGATNDASANSGNPFVDFDGSSNFNFELVSNTTPGFSLSASLPSGCAVGVNCYNIDGAGVTRGSNGTWDRGAYQIGSATPIPPSNVNPTIMGFTLPQCTVGAACGPVTLAATGGSPPYVWSVSPLLEWLPFSAAGVLGPGTPTTSGSTALTFTVTDSAEKTGSAAGTLTVAAPAPPPALLDATIFTPYASLTFSGTTGAAIASQSFSIGDSVPNSVGATFQSLTTDALWLGVTPASGSTYPSGLKITVAVNTSGLAAGTHTGHVIVTEANQAGYTFTNSPLAIPVTLTLTAPVTPTLTAGACTWNSAHTKLTCTWTAANLPATSGAATATLGGASATDTIPAP
jgi:hypothetical protein